MSQRKSRFSTRLPVRSESATQDSDSAACVDSQEPHTQQPNLIGRNDDVYRPSPPVDFEPGNTEEVIAWMHNNIPQVPGFVYDSNDVTASPLGHIDQTLQNNGEETMHSSGEEHYDDLQDAQGPETIHTPDGFDSPLEPGQQNLDIDQVRILDRAGNISIRTIGDSHDLWCSNDGDKIVCEYNPAWQPVGLSAKKFNRMIGDIMRSGQFVGISTPWLKVPRQTKEDIWNSLMTHFYIPPECNLEVIKQKTFQQMGKLLRNYKYRTKKGFQIKQGDTPASLKETTENLDDYDPEDLDCALEKWCDPNEMLKAERMKTIRAKHIMVHSTGSKSYARGCHEKLIKKGTLPTRAEWYIGAHTRKRGGFANTAIKEKVNKMKELLPNDSAATSSITDGTIRWAPGDAYALAMDNMLEYAGRVRGIGGGIQPVKGTTVKYYTPATRSQTSLQSVVDEQKKLIEEQRIELIEIREQLATQQAQAIAQQAQAEAQALAKEQAYEARLSMIESFMRASVGTSHIFNTVQENQPTQAMVRSSVASRPGEEDRDVGHATSEPGQRASSLSQGSAQLSRGSPHT